MKLDMMANYSQISMDLEQNNLQMVTNSMPSTLQQQQQQHQQQQQQQHNYYTSSQSLFDTLSSPSSTASSTASSASSSANSTPASKMDYHTFNNTSANSAVAASAYENGQSSVITITDSNGYGNNKRPKSNLLPFSNLYQNGQQQQNGNSFRPQLTHSVSSDSNPTTQDLIIKPRANIPVNFDIAQNHNGDNNFLLYNQPNLKQLPATTPFYSNTNTMSPQPYQTQQQQHQADMSHLNSYSQYFNNQQPQQQQQAPYTNSFYANNTMSQFDLLASAANVATNSNQPNVTYMNGSVNTPYSSYLSENSSKKVAGSKITDNNSLTQLQNVSGSFMTSSVNKKDGEGRESLGLYDHLLAKSKESRRGGGAANSYDEDDEDEDEEDEDDEDDENSEDDEDEEEDEDDYSDSEGNKNYAKLTNINNKKPLTSTSSSKSNTEHYEQNNANSESGTNGGGYLSSLFNSPSSLSSSSQNKKTEIAGGFNGSVVNSGHIQNAGKAKKGGNKAKKMTKKQQQAAAIKLEMSGDGDTITHNPHGCSMDLLDESNAMSAASNSSNMSKHSHYHHHHFQRSHAHQEAYDLAGILDDYELVNLPLRELNKRLRYLPKQMAYGMKKRRRTLKNRKYAQNCRSKRLEQKSEMEVQNCHLKHEINRLNRFIESLKQENAMLKSYVNKSEHDLSNSGGKNSGKSGSAIPSTNSSDMGGSMVVMNMATNALTSQLTHLLSMPLIKSSDNVGMSNMNNI